MLLSMVFASLSLSHAEMEMLLRYVTSGVTLRRGAVNDADACARSALRDRDFQAADVPARVEDLLRFSCATGVPKPGFTTSYAVQTPGVPFPAVSNVMVLGCNVQLLRPTSICQMLLARMPTASHLTRDNLCPTMLLPHQEVTSIGQSLA